ncbi:MAG: MBL fold metallo-hydrolase [Methylobacterium sp.]|uniref:MBL fold metallo-hydrolase n=1 Tax=Methylobacterium sp. TaxID=409 RepID=UPI0025F23C78|nr:MBL fold metallo-hydrolase [Methylobacterium sp.]MBX9932296.1 MBL fold metallo-hydrolase [Methylobacterium sp.]
MAFPLSRRGLLGAAAAFPLVRTAWADAAIRVGGTTIEALRDGSFPLEPKMIPGADSDEGRALLGAAGLPPAGPTPEPVNAFLVRRAGRAWLIDAGCGGLFGPDFGKVPAALGASGIEPGAIEAVWLTHLHIDHAGGLLDPKGVARFPQAEILVQEAEIAYWSDDAARSRAPAEMGPFFDAAQAVLAAYRGRVRAVSGAADLAPGIAFMPLPGHTPGHSGVLVTDGNDRLLVWGDIVHSRILQMPHPEWSVIWDLDQAQARATRRRILDQAAADGLVVAGMHVAARGRIERRGNGYALVDAA